MATLHLLHGFIGAGKTTFARKLERSLRAVRLSPDEWMVALYGVDPSAEHFAQYHARIERLIEAQWTRLLALGLDVVLDSGCWSRAERDRAREQAGALGAAVKLYRLHVPDSVALTRVQQRNGLGTHLLYCRQHVPGTARALRGPWAR